MKTVFTHGGPNPYNPKMEALIVMQQSETKSARFTVTYGLEVTPNLSYARACTVLGAAIMHDLACEGLLNNQGA